MELTELINTPTSRLLANVNQNTPKASMPSWVMINKDTSEINVVNAWMKPIDDNCIIREK